MTKMGDEGHQYHAMEFLMYAYLQSGREDAARELMEEVKTLPKMRSMYGIEADPQVLAEVCYSASYVLEPHDWEKAAKISLTSGTELGDDSISYLTRTIGEAQRISGSRQRRGRNNRVAAQASSREKASLGRLGRSSTRGGRSLGRLCRRQAGGRNPLDA